MTIGRYFSGWIGGLIVALAVVLLALLGWVLFAPPGAQEEASPVAAVVEPEPEAPHDAAIAPAQPETQPVPPAVPDEPEAPAPLAPAFDVVRITPDGSAIVAGRAEPGAEVSVLVEGGAVARAAADAGAGFVAMFTLPPLETDRVMTLEAVLSDGTRLASEMNVIIEGVAKPEVAALAETAMTEATVTEPEPAIAVTAAGEPEAQTGVDAPPDDVAEVPQVISEAEATAPEVPEIAPDITATAPESPVVAEAPAAPVAPSAPEPAQLAPPAAPEAPRILLAGPDGIRVLQDTSPRAQLSIDAISYNDAGEVALAGRGQGDDTLRIYLDNAPVGTAQVGPGGEWRAPLPEVDAGVYTLRVDSLSADGEVTSRVETPFKREEPAVLAAAGEMASEAAAAGRTLSAITVQPGHTLWAIAEGRYGEGISYWTIFRANRDQIRDPDWIYPGQVFTLPDTAK